MSSKCTGMHRLTTFRSTTDRIYDGSPIILSYYNIKVRPITGHEVPKGEQRYSFTLSLTSALDGVVGQRHAPAALPPENRAGRHCIGCRVGPRAGLDGCGKSRPHLDPIPGPCSLQQVAIPTTLSRSVAQEQQATPYSLGVYQAILSRFV